MPAASHERPLVSIVMPAYNSASYIAQALEALMLQDYENFELIVVDDGSTDNTAFIVSVYAEQDERLRYEYQEHNGAGAARNLGMNRASGTYLLFVDSDDVFEVHFLSTMVQLACLTGADVSVCSADCFTGDPAVPVRRWEARRFELGPGCYSAEELALWLYQCMSVVVWNKLWKRDFVRDAQLSFQNVPRYNDAFFTITGLAQAHSIAKTDDVLVHYRVASGQSLVDRASRYPLCELEALDAARSYLHEKVLFTQPLKRSFDTLCVSTIVWRLMQFARTAPEAAEQLYDAYFCHVIHTWGLERASFPYIRTPRYALEHYLIKQAGVYGLMWAIQGDTRNRSSASNVVLESRLIARLLRAIVRKGKA